MHVSATTPTPAPAPFYLEATRTASNQSWPMAFFRHERLVLVTPTDVAAMPTWTSLEQAIAGAGQLSRERDGALVAILRPTEPGGAFAAASLVVERDDVSSFELDQATLGWTRMGGAPVVQPRGAALDLHAGGQWSDSVQVDRIFDASRPSGVVGVVGFREGWGSSRSMVDVDLMSTAVD